MPPRAVLVTARYLVYLSIAELVTALYVITTGLSLYHARIMAYAALPTFVVGVAVAYASSSLRGQPGPLARALQMLTLSSAWAVGASGAYAAVTGNRVPLGVSILAFGAFVAGLTPFSLRKADVRASVLALGYTQALGGAALLLSGGQGLYNQALVFITLEAVGAIYAVTLHSFPSTFGDAPSLPLTTLTLGLLALGAVMFLRGLRYYQAALGASMILSFPAFKGHRLPRYHAKAKGAANPIARGGTLFFLYGHAFAFASLLAVGGLMVSSVLFSVGVLYVIHAVTLGVISMFILIHAPMMLPVIMGWSSARRYSLAPFILEAAGAALWPLNMHVSFFFVGLAFVFDALIVKPSREPLPLSLVR